MKAFMWLLVAALLLRRLVTGTHASKNSTNHPAVHSNRSDVDPRCNYKLTSNGFWDATCRLNDSLGPPIPFVLFESLDISRNSFKSVPTEFLMNQSQLRNLSLAHNNISGINNGSFGTLKNLTILDLSFNPLQTWEGDVSSQLPNLMTLDVTGSTWIPDSNVLTIPSLKHIFGVTWSEKCVNCMLFNMKKANLSVPFTPNVDHGNPAVKFAEHGFYPFCNKHQRKCAPKVIRYPETKKITSVPEKLFYSSYIIGAIAILLNMIILITVLFSRSLRQTTSMLLITNMAVCDLLSGIYSVIIGDLNIFHSLSTYSPGDKLVIGGGVLCKLSTAIFTCAQCLAAVTSLLLTVEKYFSIVHCMNPDRRLSKKMAAVFLLPFWILSLGYALSPLLNIPNLSFSATFMCSVPVSKNTDLFLISLGVLIALYIVNIPLYVGIFLFVRKSGAHLGIKREAAILKKIALVIGTNFVFFLTPMILIITLVPAKNIHNTIELSNDYDNQILFVFGFWFPNACFGLNACINPILCAFRQGQFIKEIRKVLNLHIMPPQIVAFFSRGDNGSLLSLSQLGSASTTQVVLYKVTHYDS